ncbi:MAG: guanylate kinase [Fimbriimonadaceae bacterium]|nr:guanylate kinase [Fimbriimonadaceae bacterium]
MPGKLVILSGPSGVGKDTVINAWRDANPRVERVVAYTTRQPRPGEIPDVDYHFVSVERFHKLAASGAFLEHKEVHGNFYATPLTDMETMLAEGKIAILKIDVQGALAVMELRADAISVFILPPSELELRRRIEGRGQDSPDVIEKRMRNALGEIALADRYLHRVVNDDLERCVGELEGIVGQGL